LIVPTSKQPDEFRMILDTRYPSSQLVAIAGCLPILEVILQHLKLALVFSSLDAFKGFKRFPLDVDCQEIYTLLTDIGIFTPKRIVQGSTDSAHAFQAGMYESIDSLLFQCVLIWIDDLLVYSKSFEEHLQNLRKVFERLRKFNIKLNPKKSKLFALHIIWCGRKISKDGVSFYPTNLKGLPELPRPETAKQLLHLLSALYWIRSTIPEYARNLAPLQELLKRWERQANSAKVSKLSRISLVHGVTWMADHDTAFSSVKELVAHAVTLAHAKQDYELCLFTHASDFHLGIT